MGDYEDDLFVCVRNTGVGPLIVENFVASDGDSEWDAIISLIPKPPKEISWSTFTQDIDGWCIPPSKQAVLVKLEGDPNDERFASFRDDVRRTLSRLAMKLTYKDIYGRRMPINQRDLSWFARHFAGSDALISNEKA
jgi:hypothetical protein